MNEIELIRAQLNLERQHASAVVRACASASGNPMADAPFRTASVEYLAWILSRFEEREQVFRELLRKRFTEEDAHRRAVEAALALPGSNREALAKLEAVLSASSGAPSWSEFLHFFNGPWSTRRDEIDRLFAAHARVPDWRTVSAIDADSIVDERNRWARVKATMPVDMELSSNTAGV